MSSVKSASGVTLRIAGTEGTVSLKDGQGKNVRAAVNLLLHDGYELATGADSAVYVSLDEKDVVKLGASGKLKIEKAGSGLKAVPVSGELQSGLAAAELKKVSASNMATGIRG